MFAPWCFPARFSQTSSAELSCGDRHTMLLCPPSPPSELLHSSTTHNSSLWSSKIPRPQLPVPKYCPLLSTHTVTGSGRTARGHKQRVRGPERARGYTGTHTWKHTHTLTHLTYMKMNTHQLIRPDPSQPLAAWAEVAEVTQLLSLTGADDRGGVWRSG